MNAEAAFEIVKKYPQHENALEYSHGFAPLYDIIAERLPHFTKALDIGCAYGMMSLMLSDQGEVTAADMTKKFTNVKMLNDYGVYFHKVNLEKDEVPGVYDLILMTEVLEHLNSNPLPSIKKLYNALEEKGHLVITTPAREIHGDTKKFNKGVKGLWNDCAKWQEIGVNKGKWRDEHTFHYDQWNLVTLLTEAGFSVIQPVLVGDFSHLVIAQK